MLLTGSASSTASALRRPLRHYPSGIRPNRTIAGILIIQWDHKPGAGTYSNYTKEIGFYLALYQKCDRLDWLRRADDVEMLRALAALRPKPRDALLSRTGSN